MRKDHANTYPLPRRAVVIHCSTECLASTVLRDTYYSIPALVWIAWAWCRRCRIRKLTEQCVVQADLWLTCIAQRGWLLCSRLRRISKL